MIYKKCQSPGIGGTEKTSAIKLSTKTVLGIISEVAKLSRRAWKSPLTNRATNMRTTEVRRSARNGTHAELIESSAQETGESTGKRNGAAPCGSADGHAHQVLLGDEALHVAVRVRLLEVQRKGRVLCVSVHRDDAVTAGADLGQCCAVGLAGCNLERSGQHRHEGCPGPSGFLFARRFASRD